MGGEDHVASHSSGLSLGEDDYFNRPLRKSVENSRHLEPWIVRHFEKRSRHEIGRKERIVDVVSIDDPRWSDPTTGVEGRRR